MKWPMLAILTPQKDWAIGNSLYWTAAMYSVLHLFHQFYSLNCTLSISWHCPLNPSLPDHCKVRNLLLYLIHVYCWPRLRWVLPAPTMIQHINILCLARLIMLSDYSVPDSKVRSVYSTLWREEQTLGMNNKNWFGCTTGFVVFNFPSL